VTVCDRGFVQVVDLNNDPSKVCCPEGTASACLPPGGGDACCATDQTCCGPVTGQFVCQLNSFCVQ
jgi:hypothetical protein